MGIMSSSSHCTRRQEHIHSPCYPKRSPSMILMLYVKQSRPESKGHINEISAPLPPARVARIPTTDHIIFLILFLHRRRRTSLGASFRSTATVRADVTSRVVWRERAVVIEEVIFAATFPRANTGEGRSQACFDIGAAATLVSN